MLLLNSKTVIIQFIFQNIKEQDIKINNFVSYLCHYKM